MERYDEIDIYCRRLGHYVPFKYCRMINEGLPCSRIMDCAFEKFPVQEFLKENYTEEELEKIFLPPENKISSLVDLIERARNLTAE